MKAEEISLMVPKDTWWTFAVVPSFQVTVCLSTPSTLCELGCDQSPNSISSSAHCWLPSTPLPPHCLEATIPCGATPGTGHVMVLGQPEGTTSPRNSVGGPPVLHGCLRVMPGGQWAVLMYLNKYWQSGGQHDFSVGSCQVGLLVVGWGMRVTKGHSDLGLGGYNEWRGDRAPYPQQVLTQTPATGTQRPAAKAMWGLPANCLHTVRTCVAGASSFSRDEKNRCSYEIS